MPPEFQAKIDALKADQKRVSEDSTAHRDAFAAILKPGNDAFKQRTEDRAKAATAPGVKVGARTKGNANVAVLAEMLAEDTWHPIWKEIKRSDDEAHKLELEARASSKLPTGTYQKIDDAFQRAKKDSSPRAPRFHGLRGTGLLSVQVVGKRTYSQFAAESVRQSPHDPTKQGDQSRMKIVTLDQSIPRDVRQAIVATVKMHRDPPADAIVKWASWVVGRIGNRTTLELQLTLEHASFSESKRPAGARAPEHVQIGWSRVNNGIRVAHWPGGEVVVPEKILSQHTHACLITSAADKVFFRAKKFIRRLMRRGPYQVSGWHLLLSDRRRRSMRRWCFEYAEYVLGAKRADEMWCTWVANRKRAPRSPDHTSNDLYAASTVLRSAFNLNDEDAVALWCFVWAQKDKHLSQYAVDSAQRFENRRDMFFRLEAIRISTEFAELTVDDYDIASLKKLDPVSMPNDFRDHIQLQLHMAAPGRFREILKEVMGPRCVPCKRPGDNKKSISGGGARGELEHKGDPTKDAIDREDEEAAE